MVKTVAPGINSEANVGKTRYGAAIDPQINVMLDQIAGMSSAELMQALDYLTAEQRAGVVRMLEQQRAAGNPIAGKLLQAGKQR